MGKLEEVREKLARANAEVLKILAAKPDRDFTTDEFGTIQKCRQDIEALRAEETQLVEVQAIEEKARADHERLSAPATPMVHPHAAPADGQHQQTAKRLRDIIAESPAYKAFEAKNYKGVCEITVPRASVKTLVQVATLTPLNMREGIEPMAAETRTVRDLMLQGNLSQGNTIEYYEQTTRTNNAATVAEGATKPESAFAYTLRSDTARKIAHFIPVTDEALRDVDGMQSLIEDELVFDLKRIEEAQLLTGDGIAPNIKGLLTRTGIQTQAKGADSTPVALMKAIVKIENVGFAEPNGMVMNPTDWQNLVTLQDTTGRFIFGPIGDALPTQVWGLPIRRTTVMTLGTTLIGDFRRAKVYQRDDVVVTASTEHSTFFVENKVAILVEERVVLQVRRPSAFCTVTGL